MLVATDWQRFDPIFTPQEWAEDPSKVDPLLVYLCYMLRKTADVPMHIHEAFARGGHSGGSRHYLDPTDAVDFHFGRSRRFSLIDQLHMLDRAPLVGAIGFYPHWDPEPGWHIDLRPRDGRGRRLYWVRDHRGGYTYWREPFAALLPAVQLAEGARWAKGRQVV